MQASPTWLLQLAVCLAAQLKGTTRWKDTTLAYSQQHWQLIWALPSLPLRFCFFSPVCRKRTASVCNCCYETRPHKCPSFSSPGNYLPTDILLNFTWSRFCSATIRHRPGSILHPVWAVPSVYAHTKKKDSPWSLDFPRLTKHLQDLHSLNYQVLPFLFLFNWVL